MKNAKDIGPKEKSYILIAEIRRCVEDDKIMQAYRKLVTLEDLIRKEMWTWRIRL